MARRTAEQQLAELKEREKALKARIAKTERANDTRRKVILGTLVLRDLAKDDDTARQLAAWVRRELPSVLTRDHDREIFADLLSDG